MKTVAVQDIFLQSILTEQGVLTITASARGVTRIAFSDSKDAVKVGKANEITQEACSQLSAYFAKTRQSFDLPIDAVGTEFQMSVWKSLQSIPFGHTVSYLDVAKDIGNPKAVRAVGLANGKNPIAIVVPCHRVIGSNKTLTGYAGGLARKQFLLNLEGAQGGLWD